MGDVSRITSLALIADAMTFLSNAEIAQLAERLYALTPADKRKKLIALSSGRDLTASAKKSGKLTVLPGLSFQEMIDRCEYYWKSTSVSASRFGVNAGASGDWEWDLYHFGRPFSTKDGERSLPSSLWIHGQAEHLFAFGASHSELLRDGPVMALDARCEQDGHVHVAVLEHDGAVMHISSYRLENGSWPAGYRLLHVKKSRFASGVMKAESLDQSSQGVLPLPTAPKSLFRK